MQEVKQKCRCLKISRCLEQELKANIPTSELNILVALEENVDIAMTKYKGNLVQIPELGEDVYFMYILCIYQQ